MYNASKYAVRGFTEAARHDLAGTPVRVTHISPGLVGNTEFSNVRLGDDSKAAAGIYIYLVYVVYRIVCIVYVVYVVHIDIESVRLSRCLINMYSIHLSVCVCGSLSLSLSVYQ